MSIKKYCMSYTLIPPAPEEKFEQKFVAFLSSLRICAKCWKRKDKNAKGAQRVRAEEEDVGETALASLYLSAGDQSP